MLLWPRGSIPRMSLLGSLATLGCFRIKLWIPCMTEMVQRDLWFLDGLCLDLEALRQKNSNNRSGLWRHVLPVVSLHILNAIRCMLPWPMFLLYCFSWCVLFALVPQLVVVICYDGFTNAGAVIFVFAVIIIFLQCHWFTRSGWYFAANRIFQFLRWSLEGKGGTAKSQQGFSG